ncbi:probable F-box protein At4g22030 [Beta vulgaris subsp. vulgaris]|uniref:probable F-box protein At4g22030 n=1 Tax=Beta vulgaris subsp. vulgaris TaxID=3555 RepID=UPI002036C88B|nr:probable F-box protein At4g22030 [Beta vulgaris subsp. vulgaris]
MTTLQSSSIRSLTIRSNDVTQSLIRSMTSSLSIKSAISIPKLPNNGKFLKNLNISNVTLFKKNTKTVLPSENISTPQEVSHDEDDIITSLATIKLHVILEAVLDRIEMHQNIGKQRENWNSLLLNSLNMVTLTATTMVGMAVGLSSDEPVLGLKVASTLLFVAGTGILSIMNKIQPSQLVEEQRNAVRLFKKLRTEIETCLSLESPTEEDVEEAMERVLALDKAYPLPLLGAMIDKFPNTFKPAMWWPFKKPLSPENGYGSNTKENLHAKKEGVVNGWSKELEEEMKQIVGVIDRRDIEDFVKLGNKALKLNKTLAVSGPLLMGIAAVGSAFGGHGGAVGGVVAAVAGSLASVVNTIEHGGQVGMVFEMYRNCAGFFNLLEEKVKSNLEEKDLGKRENGELFEMKMALHLGRSLSELRDFAAANNSSSCASEVGSPKGEFASKLF